MSRSAEEINQIKQSLNSLIFLCDNYNNITESIFNNACYDLIDTLKLNSKYRRLSTKQEFVKFLKSYKNYTQSSLNVYVSCIDNLSRKLDLKIPSWEIKDIEYIQSILDDKKYEKILNKHNRIIRLSLKLYIKYLLSKNKDNDNDKDKEIINE